LEIIKSVYNDRESQLGVDSLRELEHMIMLQILDISWKDYLWNMDSLREGIGMRGYAQLDPLVEYRREGSQFFMNMIEHIKEETIQYLFRFQIRPTAGRHPVFAGASGSSGRVYSAKEGGSLRKQIKVGRNDPCPCGSGKKFKHCCGRPQ